MRICSFSNPDLPFPSRDFGADVVLIEHWCKNCSGAALPPLTTANLRSRPVSRILCLPRPWGREQAVTIHLGGALLRRSCGLPGSEPSKSQTSNFETRDLKGLKRTAFNTASLFGLAPQGACLAEPVARLAGEAFTSPFHHRPRRCRPRGAEYQI